MVNGPSHCAGRAELSSQVGDPPSLHQVHPSCCPTHSVHDSLSLQSMRQVVVRMMSQLPAFRELEGLQPSASPRAQYEHTWLNFKQSVQYSCSQPLTAGHMRDWLGPYCVITSVNVALSAYPFVSSFSVKVFTCISLCRMATWIGSVAPIASRECAVQAIIGVAVLSGYQSQSSHQTQEDECFHFECTAGAQASTEQQPAKVTKKKTGHALPMGEGVVP